MALGSGQIANAVALADSGDKTILMRQSLDMAADALAEGNAIPKAAHLARAVLT